MPEEPFLDLSPLQPLQALNAGLFVSRGKGKHPNRIFDSYELIFVRQGCLGMREGHSEFVLCSGQTLLLYPGRRHLGTEAYPADLSFYWIHFKLRGPPSVKKKRERSIRLAQVSDPAQPDRLAELFHRYLDDQESGRLDPISSRLTIMLMLWEAGQEQRPNRKADHPGMALAARAEKYIATHFHESIGTAQIAAQLDVNPDYLGRVYKTVYGRTLTDGIHQWQVREARALLRESKLNIDQIAAECGFSDVAYFRRIFKRATGLTPKAFRMMYTRVHVVSR